MSDRMTNARGAVRSSAVGKPAAMEPTVTGVARNTGAKVAVATAQRRATRRVPHRVPCRVHLIDARTGASRALVGETIDLSPAGAAIRVGVDVPVGTWVETLVPHAHGDPLFICGVVVRSRQALHQQYEIGIEIAPDATPDFL